MTTDPFVEAARAESRRQWPMRDQRSAFESGARWARRYLAAQESTDDEVEAAARAMRIETLADTVRPGAAARWWDNGDVSPDEADKLRRLARAALSAARRDETDEDAWTSQTVGEWLEHRATEYETGGQR